ncbi:hypothetical protein L6452_01329 [Arctium lappa]|uniref:Uncharacterized protein n=1 Tax=Arctium lappa TaxID=4217 RepID=A0ACB9FG15_ARCLA|nr:hypothetical protein L6452_01329 [Arctium lappa]
MEVSLSAASTTTRFSISRTLHCSTQLPILHAPRFTTTTTVFLRSSPLFGLRAAVPPALECVSFASSSGDGGIGGAAETETETETDDVSVLSSDVIILDVRGMTCGGCSASVKRILENQAQVSSASVNLTTETAIVWPLSEAKVTPNWQKVMGEELAKHLTTCGFSSNLRGEAAATEGEPS